MTQRKVRTPVRSSENIEKMHKCGSEQGDVMRHDETSIKGGCQQTCACCGSCGLTGCARLRS